MRKFFPPAGPMNTVSRTQQATRVVRKPRVLERIAAEMDWKANTPSSFYARFGHRLLDLTLLAICLPLTVVPALLISLINGIMFRSVRRIFYVQRRVGLQGKIFHIFKFRTMRDAPAGDMHSWANGHDQDRVTPFGRFLRSSHLDELPQLINVLKGDMSFIGPRPEMVEIEEWAVALIPGFLKRLSVRPGITGFAQITQGYTSRNAGAYQRKLDLCLSYNESISFAVDVSVLWQTVFWMLRRKGWQWESTDTRLTRTAFRVIANNATKIPDVEPPPIIPSRSTEVPARSEEC